MTAAIDIRGLVKTYGRHRALDGLDLRVEEGAVFGFLGANGAGKTTTLRTVLALTHPTAGTVNVFGHAPGSAAARQLVGFCPDVPGFLPWMTARDVLETTASLFRLSPATTRRRVGELLDLAGLKDTRLRVGGYSRGMRQRLGLAQALVNSPRLLLLDEPTSALDPLGRRMVLDLITALRGHATVFFSTHLLPDVERVCDSVAIVHQGKVAANGTLDEVRAALGGAKHRVLVTVDDRDRLRAALTGRPWIVTVADSDTPDELALSVTDIREASLRLPAEIAALGLRLHRLEPREASLEDIFIDTVGGPR
ncbi:ABC transporter ATP-binding protein [Streptomyces sp. NPDC002734]|uniref:ABC transporter ATP-binding protein n=1 Tax=Streptomyces sp. NPDC002734 TaxID=3154426 RepID=UPI003324ED34